MTTKPFISLDWGTSSFRAYMVGAQGEVEDTFESSEGILAVKDGAFEAVLESHIGTWDKSLPVIASGMITSKQGWVECAYAECPATLDDLAKKITVHKTKSGRTIHFLTGLHFNSHSIGHDVMRGEETQVFGSLSSGARHFVTPGTHSKWIDASGESITQFSSYMTGEVFALLRNHSILGRLMTSDTHEPIAFRTGLDKAMADPAGFMHSIFSVRSLGLFQAMPPEHLSSYLSGLVIGTEIAHATAHHSKAADYVILASVGLGARYLEAMQHVGLNVAMGDALAVIKGQAAIAQKAGVI
jgi:2-dehydro-3-deoxygalactonokinase